MHSIVGACEYLLSPQKGFLCAVEKKRRHVYIASLLGFNIGAHVIISAGHALSSLLCKVS